MWLKVTQMKSHILYFFLVFSFCNHFLTFGFFMVFIFVEPHFSLSSFQCQLYNKAGNTQDFLHLISTPVVVVTAVAVVVWVVDYLLTWEVSEETNKPTEKGILYIYVLLRSDKILILSKSCFSIEFDLKFRFQLVKRYMMKIRI